MKTINSLATTCRASYFFKYCAAVLLAISTFNPVAANAADEHKFDALGYAWSAGDLNWIKIENQWLVATNINIVQTIDRTFSTAEMHEAFCTEILKEKVGAPDRNITRKDIFRVSVNVIKQNGRPVWPLPIPIPVSDGECQITDGSKPYYPTYPGRLNGWRLTDAGIQKSEGNNRIQLTFEPDEGVSANSGSFDFAAACEATRVDPSVRAMQSQFEQLAQAQNIELQSDIIAIFVKFPVEPGKNYGAFAGNFFDISSGACVEHK